MKRTRIDSLSIRNYKGIESLDLSFPAPQFPGNADMFVIGSENGLGKTSVLECCALMLGMARLFVEKARIKIPSFSSNLDVPDFLLRSGATSLKIEGELTIEGISGTISIEINKAGILTVTPTWESSPPWSKKIKRENAEAPSSRLEHQVAIFFPSLCGMLPNPLLSEHVLCFHSYRKVQEGNPELRMMVDEDEEEGIRRVPFSYPGRRPVGTISSFKIQILRALMGSKGIFESNKDRTSAETLLQKVNSFVREFAGGTIENIRAGEDNTVNIRVTKTDGSGSFTFDALSSGQKEITSTLFLIWQCTQSKSALVLIDEPELHLNAQWHRLIVNRLATLAPDNQYILATHSEDIMDSVNISNRIFLERGLQ